MRAILQHRYLFTAVLIVAGFISVQVQANEQPANEAQQVLSVADLRGYHEFNYKFEDRPDPFLPFFSDTKPPEPSEEKKIIPGQILTELQKFEAGQLKLVAVLAFKDKNIAMLEDVTGEGHLAEQGTEIGRYGIVTSIEPNLLLVTESYETTTGRKVVKEIPLHMQQQE
ncbi:MAG: pilus assembly protein PilP [Candidatus Electrothrix aestuarii]|uniref:Pilus assembly protein PilP n=1 Tax=Candidatus Electrothrix aestuarii TaxID=3062594 RepID=A0AAU8LR60_9BACT|nr:pilus assembly protein PilP [Candidatus Electrothrix aestuarii]WPD21884.1 MAG: pilus assembly protein PilP [Candidatus Electrothrix sp. GW3-3]